MTLTNNYKHSYEEEVYEAEAVSPELSVTLRSIRSCHEGAEVALSIRLESGEHAETRTLMLTMEQYLELKPTKGPLDEETFEHLEEASLLCRAIRAGEHLLSYGANTVQRLSRKLIQKGFSREVALRAAEHLASIGLINEDKDLVREIEKCTRKLWGSKRIMAHLWNRGFAPEAMETVQEHLSEIDFPLLCASLIRRHWGGLPADGEALRHMMAGLARYGYSVSEIREAIRLVRQGDEDDEEE